MPIRKVRRKRYVPCSQYLPIVGRRLVETVGSMLPVLFPKRIHAVSQGQPIAYLGGFVLKVLTFVLAHNLRLMPQEMAQVAT